MNKKILIPIIVVLVIVAGIGAYFVFQKPAFPEPPLIQKPKEDVSKNSPFASFFAVHLEAGTGIGSWSSWQSYYGLKLGPPPEWQETFWPSLVNFVKLADKYEVKLTLEFNPQWVEYILNDEKKVELLRKWHDNDHEIGLHHHPVGMGEGTNQANDWDGYTNLPGYTNDYRYRGTMDDMMKLYTRLGGVINDKILTGGTGGFYQDFPKGIIYETRGIDNITEARSKPEKKLEGMVTRIGYAWLQPRLPESLSQFKEEFAKAQPDEIFGVSTHEYDFYKNPSVIEEWFKFTKEKGIKIYTAREVIQKYQNHFKLP